MAGFFYKLGQLAGPKVRKGKWVWQSLTGDESDILAAENEVGRDLAAAFGRELGLERDAEVRRYVRHIGDALSRCVRDRRRGFHFHIAATGDPNAFALPGGYVFVTRSMLGLIGGDRDALAFILGHEMGHVIKQHAMERIVSDTALSAALRAVRVRGLAGQWVRSTGARLMQSAYSRDRELTADKLGARLAHAAGFDPEGSVRLLAGLERVTGEAGGAISEYFATHPPFAERIAELRAFVSALPRR